MPREQGIHAILGKDADAEAGMQQLFPDSQNETTARQRSRSGWIHTSRGALR